MHDFRSQNLKFKHFNDNIDIDLSFFFKKNLQVQKI